MIKKCSFLLAALGLLSHCSGTIQNIQDADPAENPEETPLAVLYGTDFSSPGEIYVTGTELRSTSLSTLDNSALGSDAVLAEGEAERIALVHSAFSAWSSNNLTLFDASNSFTLLGQFSTDSKDAQLFGTNPVAAYVVDDLAYISLANADNDPLASDIAVMDLTSGTIGYYIDLSEFTAVDSDRRPFPYKLIGDGTALYVLVQDLDSDFSVTAPGKLVQIETHTNTASLKATLLGRNPIDIARSEADDCFFIVHLAELNDSFVNDTASDFGGLEVLCENGPQRLIDDALLGGYTEKVAVAEDANTVFVVVSTVNAAFIPTSQVLALSLEELISENTIQAQVFFDPDADIREIAIDPNGLLWIAHRQFNANGSAENPKVTVLDPQTGETLATFSPALPVTSVTFVQGE